MSRRSAMTTLAAIATLAASAGFEFPQASESRNNNGLLDALPKVPPTPPIPGRKRLTRKQRRARHG